MQEPSLHSKVKFRVYIYSLILENPQVFNYTNLKGCSFYLPEARVLANLSYATRNVHLPTNIFSFLKQSPDLESFHLITSGQYLDGGFDAFHRSSFPSRFARLRTIKFGTTLDGLRSSQLDIILNTPKHLRPKSFDSWMNRTDVDFCRHIQSSVVDPSSPSPCPVTSTITSLQACDDSCLRLPDVEKAMIEELSLPPNPWMDSNLWVHDMERRLETFTNVTTLSIEVLYLCVRPHPWLVSIGQMPRLERLHLTYESSRYNEPWVWPFFM
jgi:hypothetical protein